MTIQQNNITQKLMENSKKQTAVEWLVEQFDLEMQDDFHLTKIKQAKEMEKQQIIEAWIDGNHSEMRGGKFIKPIAEQYYNETFKK